MTPGFGVYVQCASVVGAPLAAALAAPAWAGVSSLAVALAAAAAGLGAGAVLGARRQRRADAGSTRAYGDKLERTNRDLAISERYLEDFFETAPIPMHWVGPDGTVLRANRAALALLGLSRDEYVGRSLASLHADPERPRELLSRAARGETIRDAEAKLRCKDGSFRDVLVTSSPLFEGGRFVHTRTFVRDVTDLRRGQQALEQARSDLSLALSAANMGLWTRELVPEDRVWWSPELCRIFGIRPEEFGNSESAFLEFVHPDDRHLVTDAVARALRERSDYEVEFRYRCRGELFDRWMIGRGRAEYDPDGRPVRLAGIGMDVTDRKLAESEHHRAQAHYKTIVETANEGVWLIDAEARTLYVNDRMAAMLGHTPGQMVGRRVTEFCFPEDVPTARARIGHNFEGHPEQFDFRFRHLDGHGVPVLACTNAVRGSDGRITGALGLFTDVTLRKRADEELRRFKFMCDSANDAYFLADAGGRVRYANRTACELLGYAEAELLGLSVADVDATMTEQRFGAAIDDLARLGRLPPFEAVLKRKDGTTLEMEFNVARVIVSGLPHLFAVGRDISAQRRARAELRRSEETLRLACRAAAAGAWDFDVQTQRLTLTPEFRELFGVDEGFEFTYERWMGLVHPDDRGATDQRLRESWTGHLEPRLEYRVVRPDGAVRWIESKWVTLTEPGPGGARPVRMIGIAQDVTDRRDAAAALARSEARYRSLAENVPQFIWTCGPDGSADYFNQRWHDYTGLDAGQSLGSGWADAVHPEDAPALLERWSRALRHAQRIESEHRIRRADGQHRWFLTRATPLLGPQGAVTAWLATSTEIHEQKMAQSALSDLNAALARSNRDLEDFAHIAAHDLREPLRGMRLCASFLIDDHAEKLDEDARRHLASIDRLGQRMDELINSLLHYSLVGQAELTLDLVDLNGVVGTVLESLSPVLRQAGVEVRIPRALPTLRCDPVRVGEVYRNLIGNAVKYNTRADRWVEIGVTPPQNGDATPVLYVRDNGIGIAPEHRESVFRIFKRLHARDEFGGGTGSGLALVKRIVERHGGRIWVESSLDEGSTFLFTLTKVMHAPIELAHSHR